VNQTELDRLVAQIGEEILSRVGSSGKTPKQGEGLNPRIRSARVRPTLREPVRAHESDHRRGRIAVSASGADQNRSIHRRPDRPPFSNPNHARRCHQGLREARQYGFASVSTRVLCRWLRPTAGSAVKVCTVVGFPLGATSTEAKVAETAAALRRAALRKSTW
jgi:hypothetical protein